MINIIKFNAKKRYNYLFEDRFKVKVDICIDDNDTESITNYINRIKEEYEKMICERSKIAGNIVANNYINNERIRLIAKNRELNNKKLSVKYLSSLVSMLLPIFTFIIGIQVGNSNELVRFVAENKLMEADSVANAKGKVIDIFTDYLGNTNIILVKGMRIILAILIVGYVLLEIVHSYNVQKNNIDIIFNTFCLEVLESIEKKDFNLTCDIE